MVHQAGDGAASLDSAGIQLQLILSELDTRQTEAQEPVAGFEKMDHTKTTQADCK